MNSIKAFLKAKGLYLVCLALVFAATITGIAAIRSVVRGVETTASKSRPWRREQTYGIHRMPP